MYFAQVDEIAKIATNSGYTATGIAVLCLTGLAMATWRVLLWAGVRADKIVERGIQHLDVVDDTMRSIKAAFAVIEPRLERIEVKVDDIDQRVEDLQKDKVR